MDGYVVVVPTQRDEVVGIVVAAIMLFSDVMQLQPVTAWTPFYRTLSLVPLEYEVTDSIPLPRGFEKFRRVQVDPKQ
jgi:hypothetical protein